MSKARDIADLDFNSPDIDGGNIDGAVIGGTTPAAGTFSTVSTDTFQNASGNLNILSTGNILFKFDSDNNQTNRELNIQSNTGDQLVRITETGDVTFNASVTTGSDVEIRSGNKLILQRPNNAVASNISTDSTGAMILDSINSEGFFFNNNGVNAFKIDPINATFKGNVTIDNDSADPYLIIDGSTGNRDSGIKINSGGGERQVIRQDVGNNLYLAANNVLINASGDMIVERDVKAKSAFRVMEGSSTAGGIFKEHDITGSGASNDLSVFAESVTNGGDIHFMTGGSATKRVTFAANGSVGIGDDSPPSSAKLHVQSDDIGIRLDGTPNTSRKIFFRNTSETNPASLYADGSLNIDVEDANRKIRLQNQGNTKTIIDSVGQEIVGRKTHITVDRNTPTIPSSLDGGLVCVTPIYYEYQFKFSGLQNRTLDIFCGSYFMCDLTYTSHQTNGGNDIHRLVKAKWANNHTHHQFTVMEDNGGTWGITTTFSATDQNGSSTGNPNGRLRIQQTYGSGSYSFSTVTLRCYFAYPTSISYS